MKIRIDPHTLERAPERGTNAEEIKEVIETGLPLDAQAQAVNKGQSLPVQPIATRQVL